MKKKYRVGKNSKIVKRSCSLNRYYRVIGFSIIRKTGHLKYCYNTGKNMMLIQIRFQPLSLIRILFYQEQRSKEKLFKVRENFFSGKQFMVPSIYYCMDFFAIKKLFGGFHEDFYPLIYHSQRPKLSIKHLIGPKVITLIDCKVHLHKIHREHMKI